ncbi:MAG: nuclear transport factor 2 family protein [Actinomycetes bacterium]
MSAADDFRRAVESRDMELGAACLAEDVVFKSPVAFKPYESKPVVTFLLSHVIEVFEDFVYVDQASEGATHVLRFNATVNGKQVDGVDILETDGPDGLIKTFSVMVRPLSAGHALAEAMSARIEAAGGPPVPSA